MSDLQRNRLAAALKTLCERPLDHPSIARPVAAGIEHGSPYLVHGYFPGTAVAALPKAARLDLSDVILRLTYLAGALDFAEAAGVLHGALGAHDVIFSDDNAGVSGFGLVQALESAGIPGFHARREDDVAALMGIARDLLGGHVPPAVAAVLDGPVPTTALALAAALQDTLTAPPASAPTVAEPPEPEMWVSEQPRDLFDFALREEVAAPARDDVIERIDQAPAVADRPMFGAIVTDTVADTVPDVVPAASMAVRPSRGGGRGWLIAVAVAVALGIAGFAGGFFVAREDIPATPETSTAANGTPKPAPETNAGRAFTDAAVDEPKPQEPAASAPPEPPTAVPDKPAVARPPVTQPTPTAKRPTPPPATRARALPPVEPKSGPAAMRVDSRPVGAQVFVDGRSVGYTPLVVGDLPPGTHSIRMQLPGYQPWVSAVTLGPGARERVAASLEQ